MPNFLQLMSTIASPSSILISEQAAGSNKIQLISVDNMMRQYIIVKMTLMWQL